jgi:hypothetical protein
MVWVEDAVGMLVHVMVAVWVLEHGGPGGKSSLVVLATFSGWQECQKLVMDMEGALLR